MAKFIYDLSPLIGRFSFSDLESLKKWKWCKFHVILICQTWFPLSALQFIEAGTKPIEVSNVERRE